MRYARTFTKTAKVVNEDATTIYVAHFVTQVEQSCHHVTHVDATTIYHVLSRTYVRSAAMMKQPPNQQNM